MEKITLRVNDLACPDCAGKISELLRKQKGVEDAQLSFMTGKLNVSYDPDVISLDEIKKTVSKLGYKAE
ncbi:MAG: heavy-metal-associated domain-containing protein [Clostridia bacterium]|jgi:copper chaperone|nr:heavy-metal-associated domain-containing protein [Clostridia bacterium]NLL18301.1 heavy-metal-associated domain-containing protein [Clostridia bacterium]